MKKLWSNRLFKLPVFLAGVALLFAFLLGLCNEVTKGRISQNREQAGADSYLRVFEYKGLRDDVAGGSLVDVDLSIEPFATAAQAESVEVVKVARRASGDLVGFAVVTTSAGLRGEFKALTAYDGEANFLGYVTVSTADDPGWGYDLTLPLAEYQMSEFLSTGAEQQWYGGVANSTKSRNAAVACANKAKAFVQATITELKEVR